MKIKNRHIETIEAKTIYVEVNGVEYMIVDDGQFGLQILSIDNEKSSIIVKPNVANSINIMAVSIKQLNDENN